MVRLRLQREYRHARIDQTCDVALCPISSEAHTTGEMGKRNQWSLRRSEKMDQITSSALELVRTLAVTYAPGSRLIGSL